MSGTETRSLATWPLIVYHVCRIGLALVFISAAYNKILEPWGFGRAIIDYHMLPGFLVSPMVIALPWIELVCGILLLANRLVRPSAILIFIMNLMFIVAVAWAMFNNLEIDCGCGFENSPLEFLSGTAAGGWALVRDMIFLFMTWWTYAGASSKTEK